MVVDDIGEILAWKALGKIAVLLSFRSMTVGFCYCSATALKDFSTSGSKLADPILNIVDNNEFSLAATAEAKKEVEFQNSLNLLSLSCSVMRLTMSHIFSSQSNSQINVKQGCCLTLWQLQVIPKKLLKCWLRREIRYRYKIRSRWSLLSLKRRLDSQKRMLRSMRPVRRTWKSSLQRWRQTVRVLGSCLIVRMCRWSTSEKSRLQKMP